MNMNLVARVLFPARFGLALASMARGKFDRAARRLELLCIESNGSLQPLESNDIDPGGSRFVSLGECYLELGRIRDAVRMFDHAYESYRGLHLSSRRELSSNRDYREFLNRFADALRSLGDVQRASRLEAEAEDL